MSLYKKSIDKVSIPKTTRAASSKQEKTVAKAIGGKQTKNSGATPWQKGDIILDNWLIECKVHMLAQEKFSIKKEWLEKLKQESLFMGKAYEALAFDFGNGKNYYIIDERLFRYLCEILDE